MQEQVLRAWARDKVMARLMDMGRGSAGASWRGMGRGSAGASFKVMGKGKGYGKVDGQGQCSG